MTISQNEKPLQSEGGIFHTHKKDSSSQVNNSSPTKASLHSISAHMVELTKSSNHLAKVAKNTRDPAETFAIAKPNECIHSSTEMLGSGTMTIKYPKKTNMKIKNPVFGAHSSSKIAVKHKNTDQNRGSSVASNLLLRKDEKIIHGINISAKINSEYTTHKPDTFEQRMFPLLKKFDTKIENFTGSTYNVPQNYNSDLISSLASALIMCVFLVSIFYYLIGKSKSKRRFWSSTKSRKIVNYLGPRYPAVLNEEELAYHFQTSMYPNETQPSTFVSDSILVDISEPMDEKGRFNKVNIRKTIISPPEISTSTFSS